MADQRRSGAKQSPESALLGFLQEGPAHGYELHRRLITDLGHIWRCSLSQTYSILKRLQVRGDIASRKVNQAKRPPRQMLRLTPTGARRFKTWLELPTGTSVHAIRVEFLTRLYFVSRLAPGKAEELIRAQIVEVESGLVRLRSLLADLPHEQSVNRLAIEFRIVQLNSALTWLESVSAATRVAVQD